MNERPPSTRDTYNPNGFFVIYRHLQHDTNCTDFGRSTLLAYSQATRLLCAQNKYKIEKHFKIPKTLKKCRVTHTLVRSGLSWNWNWFVWQTYRSLSVFRAQMAAAMRWPTQPYPAAAAAIFVCAKMCTADEVCTASRPPETRIAHANTKAKRKTNDYFLLKNQMKRHWLRRSNATLI